jgi:GT2 family glycosyltransferase
VNAPQLLGVLVTYRRPRDLERSLRRLAGQDRLLDRLIVVDNAPGDENAAIVAAASDAAGDVAYLPMPENAGYPGGLAAGMERLLPAAADADWIAVLDDDDPPDEDGAFSDLLAFALATVARDPRTACVGLRGARFDPRRGLLTRVSTREIEDATPVDCIAGNALPLYRVGALRDVGVFTPGLFFSHEELELGLRLERAGYRLYAHGVRWRERRRDRNRPDEPAEDRLALLTPNWRSYYSLRNTIHILRANGRTGAALWVSFTRGFVKPILNSLRRPSAALRALRLNARACADAWRGRLGRRVEPVVSQPRPNKLLANNDRATTQQKEASNG